MGLGVTGQSSRVGGGVGCQIHCDRNPGGIASHSAQLPTLIPRWDFGEVDASWADGFTEMIVSPGAIGSSRGPASEQGCRVRGDIDLFVEAAKAPVVGNRIKW